MGMYGLTYSLRSWRNQNSAQGLCLVTPGLSKDIQCHV